MNLQSKFHIHVINWKKKLHQLGQRGCIILYQAHQPENLKKFFRRKPVLVSITQIAVFISAKNTEEEKKFKAFWEFFCFAYNAFLFLFTLFKKMFCVKLISFYNISESICRRWVIQEIDGISLVIIHQYIYTYININFRCRIWTLK